jgi:hypothetical protein
VFNPQRLSILVEQSDLMPHPAAKLAGSMKCNEKSVRDGGVSI